MIYKSRAIVLGVSSDGLVSANEEFTAWWLRDERSMPCGPNQCGLPWLNVRARDASNQAATSLFSSKESDNACILASSC